MLIDKSYLNLIKKQNPNKKVIFVRGTFDILHDGHIDFLKRSKNYGDILVVGVPKDEHVKLRKGENRPVMNFIQRTEVLDSIKFVDYVVEIEDTSNKDRDIESTLSILHNLKPDFFVTTYVKWKSQIIEINNFGTDLIVVKENRINSTTNLISKINNIDVFIDIKSSLEKVNMIQYGTFTGKVSGKLYNSFIDKDFLIPNVTITNSLAYRIAKALIKESNDIETVAGTMTGGALLAQLVAIHLCNLLKKNIHFVFAEKVDIDLYIRNSFIGKIKNRRVAIVDDTIRTGKSLNQLKLLVEKHGGLVVAAFSIINRSKNLEISLQGDFFKGTLLEFYEEGK